MKQIEKEFIYYDIKKKVKCTKDVTELFSFLLNKFAHQISSDLSIIALQTSFLAHRNLEGDFDVLRRTASHYIDITENYSQKEVENTREGGLGFLKYSNLQQFILAGTRFGTEKFPLYATQFDKVIKDNPVEKKSEEWAKECKEYSLNKEEW